MNVDEQELSGGKLYFKHWVLSQNGLPETKKQLNQTKPNAVHVSHDMRSNRMIVKIGTTIINQGNMLRNILILSDNRHHHKTGWNWNYVGHHLVEARDVTKSFNNQWSLFEDLISSNDYRINDDLLIKIWNCDADVISAKWNMCFKNMDIFLNGLI
jgi:hypothetical protein